MGFWDWLRQLLQGPGPQERKPDLTPPVDGKKLEELAKRLDFSVDQLHAVQVSYRQFSIPKRSGNGFRTISVPNPELKEMQRRILRRLLGRLQTHPAAMGFEPGQSIATNAAYHVGADVVVRMDIRDFFGATVTNRVRAYFYGIDWGKEATDVLVRLCTYERGLPQGAPTSPRLSNLVNFELDARLDGYAQKIGARYTRYADDITFSFNFAEIKQTLTGQNSKILEHIKDKSKSSYVIHQTIRMTKRILFEYGYQIHTKRKLNIRRKHQCQKVTGLVVNHKVALPRKTRRRLRAVEHHLANDRPATLTHEQLAGWKALQYMIETQTK
ncbi:MAG: RNA-directed DNA polymerase [Sedimentisphaerales bacterium]|nr:RNA-directed DNA polymerase [Sedimentisphaerales bacterium]